MLRASTGGWSTPGAARVALGVVWHIGLMFAILQGYSLFRRTYFQRSPDSAFANAHELIGWQATLGLSVERVEMALQAWVLQYSSLIDFFNIYYQQFKPALLASAALCLVLAPVAFRRIWRVFICATLIALPWYALYPLAPPRLMDEHGYRFIDTLAVYGGAQPSASGFGGANQFAALPSMHIGWTCIAVLWLAAALPYRRVGALLGGLHLSLMALTVMVTGNHYLLDIVAGLAVVAAAVLCAEYLWPWVAERLAHSLVVVVAGRAFRHVRGTGRLLLPALWVWVRARLSQARRIGHAPAWLRGWAAEGWQRALQRPDRLALAALAGVTLLAVGYLFVPAALIGQDSATQFYPWYDFLGERLRAGDVPGWNPYQFAGAPFAADPQSGWMYFPAMLIFAFLPIPFAAPVFVMFHLALAGFAMYALARLLGLGVGGALLAGIAYQLSGPLLGRSVCCPAALEIASWAPVALLGAELALRRRDWFGRCAGWSVAGFAVSQGLAAWLGQGVYYLLLALGAFVAWRTLLAPHPPAPAWATRWKLLVLHGGVILTIGFGLAAAAVLPRLAYVSRSNVDGGEYSGHSAWAAEIGGVTPRMVLDRLLDPTLHYPGAVVLLLSILAVVFTRGRPATRFFVVFGVAALTLATPFETPLHSALYVVLPRFEELHKHWPERVSVVGYMAFAFLAGAAADALARERLPRRRLLGGAGFAGLAMLALAVAGTDAPVEPLIALAVVAAMLTLFCLSRMQALRWVAPLLLAAIVTTDLLWAFRGVSAQAPYGGYHRVDLDAYYEPTGAVAYLRERSADAPGRYIGYDPARRARADNQTMLYRYQFAEEETNALLVNNRGTLHSLEDVQGYNPVQSRRFVEYMTMLNGHPQEYHDANVYAGGLRSPLLDLLNVRFILVPAEFPPERADLRRLVDTYPTVYADNDVRILENTEALPRMWIVHEALQVNAGEALPLLAEGEVDPRQTALLERPAPALEPASDPEIEYTQILYDQPDRIRLTTYTSAPGLLMLSETYDPDWRAYVDGKPAEIFVANHLLRAVALPEGGHIVELRYEPPTLRFGMAVSVTTASILV
ncbi:MAG: hypothetical protein DCC58_02635, partial [Chloroflexi bacterium]